MPITTTPLVVAFNLVNASAVTSVGYFTDLVLVDLNKATEVTKTSLLYKFCWSPFESYTFSSSIHKTFVSGRLVYDNGTFDESKKRERLSFKRD